MNGRDVGQVNRLGRTVESPVHLDARRLEIVEESVLRVVPGIVSDWFVERHNDTPAKIARSRVRAGIDQPSRVASKAAHETFY